jgi:hypothetical protein
MLDLTLERMWLLPPREPRPPRARTPARPLGSRVQALHAERRELNRENRCFVCRGITGSTRDRCWVGFLGVWIHFPEDGSTSCWDFLQFVGKDFAKSKAGKWRPRWQILDRVAAEWR